MNRWHLVDSWWWNGLRWVREYYYFKWSHPTDALREWEGPVGGVSNDPRRFNRCLFWTGSDWLKCEWDFS